MDPRDLFAIKAPGPTPKLNDAQRLALKGIVEAGPIPAVHGVVRWRLIDLCNGCMRSSPSRSMKQRWDASSRAMGFGKLSARPRHHAQNEFAVEAFKKTSPPRSKRSRERLEPGVEIELWFQDEARIGQKNKITRRWAKRGTRPSAPHDQRTQWAYLFGAICPEKGKGIGLVLPWCNTEAMNAHLAEIAAAVDPRRSCRPDRRSGRLAHHGKTPSAGKHHHSLPLPPKAPD